jgi:hypothetical protein
VALITGDQWRFGNRLGTSAQHVRGLAPRATGSTPRSSGNVAADRVERARLRALVYVRGGQRAGKRAARAPEACIA